MKKLQLLSTLVLTIAVLFSACSVEKRQYTSGYHVEWKNAAAKNKKIKSENPQSTAAQQGVVEEAATPVETPVNTEWAQSASEPAAVSAPYAKAMKPYAIAAPILPKSEQKSSVKATEQSSNLVKLNKKSASKSADDVPVWVLYLLAFFIPPVAVGLATDWEMTPVLVNLLLTLLCFLPGLIHAFVIISKNR